MRACIEPVGSHLGSGGFFLESAEVQMHPHKLHIELAAILNEVGESCFVLLKFNLELAGSWVDPKSPCIVRHRSQI